MTVTAGDKPRLRLIDAQPIEYEGERYLLLRDPLVLSDKNLLVPQPYVPALGLCDGSRSVQTLRAALAMRYGLFLTTQRLEDFISALDDALLLENERSQQARLAAQSEFRQAPFRPAASAGQSYPEDPHKLAETLQAYLDAHNGSSSHPAMSRNHSTVHGLVSPHIDYERGGPVYAQVWGHAAETVQQADLAIVFGTDHFSEGYPISLTRQNYATPYGVLPTAVEIVDRLAAIIGQELAFAGELHHRREHSIELAAVWMHHIRGGRPIEIVPILTGSLDTMLRPQNGSQSFNLEAVLDELRSTMHGRRVIVVAAGDLAHVGPAFGGQPTGPDRLIELKASDDELISTICQGDAEGFYSAIRRVNDENNVCGVSPIYLTLRLLGPLHGQNLGYAVCPADQNHTSVVTICGAALHPNS
jgi:MEMO1 family protein